MKRRKAHNVEIHVFFDRIQLQVPYNPEFLEELKTAIPPVDRHWDAQLKIWTIDLAYEFEIRQLVRRHFSNDNEPGPPPPRREVAPDCWRELYILPGAPAVVVNAAFRALAKECHPDRGGDPERMKALVNAVERCRELVKRGEAG